MMFACYRRDEAHDPEMYCAAVAAVLGDYEPDVVALVADPRTGIPAKHKFLPAVAEVKEFCETEAERKDRLQRYAALPKFRRVVSEAPKAVANLFVPDTSNRYAAMLKQHDAHNGERSHLGAKTCADGVRRAGIFVPLDWWEAPQGMAAKNLAGAARKYFEKVCIDAGFDPKGDVSPALVETLREQEGDENAASASVI